MSTAQDDRSVYNDIAEHLLLTIQIAEYLTQEPEQTLALMRDVAAGFQQAVEEGEPTPAGLLALHHMEQWLQRWETDAIAQRGLPHTISARDEPDAPSPRPALQAAWSQIFRVWFADPAQARQLREEQVKSEA